MIIPQNYINLRHGLKFNSVSLGSIEVYLYSEEELNKAQLGYRVDLNGKSLIGKEDGSWKESWFVIGYEDCCGDPIFIDFLNEKYPVCTAIHGEGEWNKILISDTFESFINALEAIQSISRDRENPVKLEKNPITDIDRNRVLKCIRQANKNADLDFWENWLE